MNKVALISGATDGIGKATALNLAGRGYIIHALGRDHLKGEALLQEVRNLHSEGKHQLFLFDLSSMRQVKQFLNEYVQHYSQLDVLVLNAGIYPKKHSLSEDGIDLSFSIGYISRYLFLIKLKALLLQSKIAKVIHVNGSPLGKIHYSSLQNPDYSKITSVWQNSLGSALLVQFWQNTDKSPIQQIHWNPGIVHTQTVKSQSRVVQFLSKMMGMEEADKAAEKIADVLDSDQTNRFFFKGKAKESNSKIRKGKYLFEELMNFSEEFTGEKLEW
jgi:NAD(P)-dependent dehydrogenase (short-subunit alcohol dehydrogenase family)